MKRNIKNLQKHEAEPFCMRHKWKDPMTLGRLFDPLNSPLYTGEGGSQTALFNPDISPGPNSTAIFESTALPGIAPINSLPASQKGVRY